MGTRNRVNTISVKETLGSQLEQNSITLEDLRWLVSETHGWPPNSRIEVRERKYSGSDRFDRGTPASIEVRKP